MLDASGMQLHLISRACILCAMLPQAKSSGSQHQEMKTNYLTAIQYFIDGLFLIWITIHTGFPVLQ